MSEIKLTTPEGYFDKSFERTIAGANRLRRRRRAALGCLAALLFASGVYLSVRTAGSIRERRDYLALQAETAELDIFLEVNCY